MKDPHNTGLTHLRNSTRYSVQGLMAALRHESAFRQEIVLCAILFPLAFWLGRSVVEMILLAGTCLLVLVVELLNSAIETAVDRIGAERHELSGRAKDLGSAAVLISLLLAGLCWGLIVWDRFIGF